MNGLQRSVQHLSHCSLMCSALLQGIIHRDIKPENILLMADKSIKLADFGLSIDATSERPVTRAGTLDYMAPEVCAAVQLAHSVLIGHNKGCPGDHVELQRCAKKL